MWRHPHSTKLSNHSWLWTLLRHSDDSSLHVEMEKTNLPPKQKMANWPNPDKHKQIEIAQWSSVVQKHLQQNTRCASAQLNSLPSNFQNSFTFQLHELSNWLQKTMNFESAQLHYPASSELRASNTWLQGFKTIATNYEFWKCQLVSKPELSQQLTFQLPELSKWLQKTMIFESAQLPQLHYPWLTAIKIKMRVASNHGTHNFWFSHL